MKNNFDLKKFLIENKLTANSRQIAERNDIVSTQDLDAAAAFKDAGIDMSQPVLVLTQDGGHGGQETKETVSAEEALSMFNNLRAQALESGKEDHYEFDNEIGFSAEGYEYKVAYFEEESTTTALMQKASGKLKEESRENTNLPELRKQVESKLSGKHDEHLVDSVLHDCFESAERLMDEEPGTSAADALYSVSENWEENYYDEGRDEEEAIAKDIVSVVKPLSGDSTSGMFSEIDSDLLKRMQNTPAPKDAADRLAKRKAGIGKQKRGTLQVSMGKNAEQEQKVIDIARDAIALMDEQPKTSAEEALKSVLGI